MRHSMGGRPRPRRISTSLGRFCKTAYGPHAHTFCFSQHLKSKDQPMSKLFLTANAAHTVPPSVLAFDFMRDTHRITEVVRHPVVSAAMLAVMLAGSAAVALGQKNEDQAGPLGLKQGYFYAAG